MCHQHLSFSYTSKVFLLALLDTPIPSPFISMWLLQISITPGSMNELKSNCWSSFTVITNIVHRALRYQPKWLQTLGSFSTRARAGRLQCPIAWDTEDTSCMSRDEMQSQLLWRWGPWVDFPQGRTCLQEELSQNHDSSSTASSSTASSSSSNLY